MTNKQENILFTVVTVLGAIGGFELIKLGHPCLGILLILITFPKLNINITYKGD